MTKRWIVALALLLVARNVVAKEDKEVTAAREAGKRARDFAKAHHYAEALEQFEAADQLLDGMPTMKLGAARCLEQLRRLVEASEQYNAAIWVEIGIEGLTRDNEKAQKNARVEAQRSLDKLQPRIPKLSVVLVGRDLADVKVYVDGILVPPDRFGIAFPFDPGDHIVRAERGKWAQVETRSLAESSNESIKIEVPDLPPPPPVVVVAPKAASPPTTELPHGRSVNARDVVAAREAAGKAIALEKQLHYAEALEQFNAANQLLQGMPSMALGAGRCLEQLGRSAEASEQYRAAIDVKISVQGLTTAQTKAQEDAREEARRRLDHLRPPPPPTSELPAKPSVDIPVAPPRSDSVSSGSPWKTVGWVLVVTGVVGVGGGIATGVLAMQKKSTLDEECLDGQCAPDSWATVDDYNLMRKMSIVGLIAGGVALGTGAAIIIAAPSLPGGVATQIRVGPSYVSVRTSF